MKASRFYRLMPPESPWGDYGDILIHGIASRSRGGVLQLERSGPFMPPISQPWPTVVVTAAFLKELQHSGLTGFDFSPVKKKHIPNIDWRSWNPYGAEEMKYPAGGEPENYILRRRHSPDAAKALGEMWELRFKPGIQVSHDGGYHIVQKSWTGVDFFLADDKYADVIYLTQRARDWLKKRVPEWVAFKVERVR